MATFDYSGYDDDQIIWAGGSPSNGDTITFTFPADHLISITDDDTKLVDGTDDRDDEDTGQTAIVYDEFGAVETSGQVQPRDEIALSDGTNTYFMTEIFIAATNSYYYIFQEPAPLLGVEYTVTSVTNPNSTNYSEFSNAGVVCYAPGALILTPQGERPVESLAVGDLVTTLDHGPQPIRWIRSSDHALDTASREAKAVLIAANALGPERPAQDLIVSPQHRILVGGGHQLKGLFPEQVLVPAKALTALPGVRHMTGKQKITWIHFACDGHEVVIANGCYTESLLLGPMVIKLLSAQERHAVYQAFHGLCLVGGALNGPPARDCLSVGDARRHLANGALGPRQARMAHPSCRDRLSA